MPLTVSIRTTDENELIPLDCDTEIGFIPRYIMVSREGKTYYCKCMGVSARTLCSEIRRIKRLLQTGNYYYLSKYIDTTHASNLGIVNCNNGGQKKWLISQNQHISI